VAVSIPELRTIEAIRGRLGLSVEQVRQSLDLLLALEMVEERGHQYHIAKKNLHLPSQSRFHVANHINWRLFFCNQIQKRNPSDLNYSAVHSLSDEDLIRLREMIIDFIKNSRQMVATSKEERLIAIGIDLAVF
jgi:hypothetical protein